MANLRKIETYLESHGWTREIHGDRDFDAALLAIGEAVDQNLGLIVSGDPGTGKSTLVKTIAPAFGHFRYIDCKDDKDVRKLTDDWQELWAENLQEEMIILDDVGAEKTVFIEFVEINLVERFLTQRAELYPGGFYCPKSKNYFDFTPQTFLPAPRLWITTNFNSKQFDNHYDGRLYSRMKTLCVPLHLTGPDKRHWQIAK